MRTIQYGGVLHPGDFIAVSNGNHIDFGWYAGDGRGTLQFYSFRTPASVYEHYDKWLQKSDEQKAKSKWELKRYEKGFTLKCLWKSYINTVYKTRVMRITNIEDIFTEKEDRKEYERSKEALIKLNFIKH